MLFPYEVNSYKKGVKFDFATSKRLLSMNDDGTQTDEPTSLLNFKNAAFLAKNSIEGKENYQAIQTHFKLSTLDHAKTLASYYRGTLKTYTQYTENPKLDYYKSRFAKNSINDCIDLLQRYTLNNITMKAFADVYKSKKNQYQCRDYFNIYGDTICNSNSLSLDSYEGIVTWTIALQLAYKPGKVDPAEWDARSYILKQLGKEKEPEFWDQVYNNSLLNTTMWAIQENFFEFFGCFEPPCARKFIAEKQFYEGAITNVPQLYPSLNVRSVAAFTENRELLKNKIPEIYGFYYIHFNFTGVIFGGEEDIIFSNNAGSIVNFYQLGLFYEFSRKGRTSDLAHLFNIWSPPEYFVNYMDHLFFEWYLDGIIGGVVAENLVKGYNDRTLIKLVNLISFSIIYLFLKEKQPCFVWRYK